MRKRHKFDLEATRAAGFKGRGSYKTIDGKEFLGKKDWPIRRQAIYERDEGTCQFCYRPVNIDEFEAHHHPLSRGKGGDDSMGNLKTICPPCHREQHVRPMWSSQQAEKETP